MEPYHAALQLLKTEKAAALGRDEIQECIQHTNFVAEENAKHAAAIFRLDLQRPPEDAKGLARGRTRERDDERVQAVPIRRLERRVALEAEEARERTDARRAME